MERTAGFWINSQLRVLRVLLTGEPEKPALSTGNRVVNRMSGSEWLRSRRRGRGRKNRSTIIYRFC